ncbi:MAG: lamin tail domain-containing protein, partial [Limisphaerales bacterium]
MRTHFRFVWRAAIFLLALGFSIGAARAQESVVISEFFANSDGMLLDEDGLPSDWIEIYNAGTAAVNLAGWHLTDDPGDLTKWSFPATNLPPFGFMIVFATGKEQSVPGLPLHSGFGLSTSGGYLGLIHPDGTTVASEFAPAYPRQHAGFSYGIPQSVTINKLVTTNAT